MISIRLKSEELAALQKQAEKIGAGDDLALVMGRAAAGLTRDHLYALDQSRPNKLGGKRTNFYQKAGDSVSDPAASAGVVSFTITKTGLAQRWLGGDIEAGSGISSKTGEPTKYLSIPARAETYGEPPSAFTDLVFVPRKNGGAMLVQALQTQVSISGKKRITVTRGQLLGGLVMYWLVDKVTQEEDPTVLPTEEELLEVAIGSGSQYLQRSLTA